MGFSASHVYIFDNKGSEIFTCSVTSFPADVCNAGLVLLFLILLQESLCTIRGTQRENFCEILKISFPAF